MKVHFDNVNWKSISGPNTFAGRLARKLFEMGHEVCSTANGADISLVFIERSGAPLARKVVQRLDGIWFKPSEYETKNVGIKSLYHSADAVIWQSDFDKNMTTKWWQQPKFGIVIRNGIDTTPVKELKIPALEKMVQDYERIYVCSANWHPQKRLGANIRLFEKLRKKRPSSCLIVMGSNPDAIVASPHVFYSGPVSSEVYMQVFAAASWMIHLAWADHCPNVVVEALSQGTPVVCSEVGGTKELIGEYGIVLKDQPYNYELCDYDNPPSIDIDQIEDLPDRKELDYGSIPNIDIEHCAKNYIDIFHKVIS